MPDVCLIGAGAMGLAMLEAWLDCGVVTQEQLVVCERDAGKRADACSRFGVEGTGSCSEAAAGSRVVVLAVKPQDAGPVLEAIATALEPGSTLLSIAAGLTTASMRRVVGDAPAVVRVMPNMGARVRASISAFTVDEGTGEFGRALVTGLLDAIGETVEVPEESLDLVTAVSGSGPAYFFLLVEALARAGTEQGLPPETAEVLAGETLWGAARVLRETGADAAELRRAVSSPGGTTLAALDEFEKADFTGLVNRAVEAARLRAGELAR